MCKFDVFINGHYHRSFRKRSEAEACVHRYEREDRYERDVEGYTNHLPEYEIRQME